MNLPYASTTSGERAREEIRRILVRFGCDKIGFMDDFQAKTLLVAFTWRGRPIQLKASAQGWAAAYLKENPWHSGRHLDRLAYNHRWLNQGLVAINSVLRDWVKGQITALECGMLEFDEIFLPHMLTFDGRTVLEVLRADPALVALPAPEGQTDAA